MGDLPPIPDNLTPQQKATVLRKLRDIQAKDLKYVKAYTKQRQKQRDLAITRHETMILALWWVKDIRLPFSSFALALRH
jgi:hypothetical protein